MRHPLWLVNAILLIALVATIFFVIFSSQKIPQPVSLSVAVPSLKEEKDNQTVNLEEVYENDLFNTYIKIDQQLPIKEEIVAPFPQPPTLGQNTVPDEPKQPFLAPLDITLKGILYVDDNSHDKALIMDNKTNTEQAYKIGDKIEDAQLVRVFSNRIILIRSNGQQETLYINATDIEKDPAFIEAHHEWNHIVKKVSTHEFNLDHKAFRLVCKNLARFIDMLDITTVYKEGKSIGCRVGTLASDSLGAALGLESFDIITSINNFPTTSTDERYAAYQDIIEKKYEDTINLKILRGEQEQTITYTLYDLSNPLDESIEVLKQESSLAGIHIGPSEEEVKAEQIDILKEQYKFAPTHQELKIKEKMNMLSTSERHD